MTDSVSNTSGEHRHTRHMLTGLTSWTLIVAMIVCLLAYPRSWLVVTAVLLSAFLLRAAFVFAYSMIGERRCREWSAIDWTEGDSIPGSGGFSPADVRHAVLVPNYKEPVAVLRRTLQALAAQYKAAERLIVVLGMEEREPDARFKGLALAEEFSACFRRIIVAMHPANLPGEIPGKASNEQWAFQVLMSKLEDDPGIDPDLVTVTSCDADSVIHPSYFAAVSRLFAEADDRYSRFWHAPMQYMNNIWRVPAPVRFVTWFGQAWLRANLTMPFYASLPISTYTLSLRLATDAGGWDPAVIPEDWHMFLRCFFERGERLGLTPVFLPTDADAAEGETWFSSMKVAFQQAVRHSWGAEDVGYVMAEMSRRGFGWRAALRFAQVYSDHVLRGIGWFLVMGAYLLAMGVNPRYEGLLSDSFLNVGPQAAVLGPIFGVGAVVMVGTLVFEISRQRIPGQMSRIRLIAEQCLMWMCLPFLGLYFGMLPTMQAQTMLALGVPISYKVTPKRVGVLGKA